MGLLDSIKGLFGDKTKTDQLKDLADRNNDGAVNIEDFNEVKSAADINQDGTVNKEDLEALKNKLPGQS